MTLPKLISIFAFYQRFIRITPRYITNPGMKSGSVRTAIAQENPSPTGWADHLSWMCKTQLDALQGLDVQDLLAVTSTVEKAMRWLGFMQGVLFTLHYFTIEDLRDHSRTETNLDDEY